MKKIIYMYIYNIFKEKIWLQDFTDTLLDWKKNTYRQTKKRGNPNKDISGKKILKI